MCCVCKLCQLVLVVLQVIVVDFYNLSTHCGSFVVTGSSHQ